MMMKNDSGTCGIYKITRKDTGQAYIGLSENIERRWHEHTHNPSLKHSYIDRAIHKYGEDKFYFEIVEELPNDRALLMEREAYWVAYYDTYKSEFHYNLTPGGDFNPAKLPEVQAKISKAKSGENHHFYGVKGEKHPRFGKKCSEETRKKISEANKNPSEETRKKISEALKGKHHSEERKRRNSEAKTTSGYYRVYKDKNHECKQGFTWAYQYHDNDGKRHKITSVSLEKLEQKVRAKGLKWLKFEEK